MAIRTTDFIARYPELSEIPPPRMAEVLADALARATKTDDEKLNRMAALIAPRDRRFGPVDGVPMDREPAISETTRESTK